MRIALVARGDHKLFSREPQTASRRRRGAATPSRRPLQDQGRRAKPRSHATAERHRKPAADRHSATTGSPTSSKSSRTGKLPLPRKAGGTYLPVRNVLALLFLYKGSPSSWEGGVNGGGGGGLRGLPGGVRLGLWADFLWRSSLAALWGDPLSAEEARPLKGRGEPGGCLFSRATTAAKDRWKPSSQWHMSS